MPAPFPGLKRWPCPQGSFFNVRRRGHWLTMGAVRQATAFIDLQTWPPNAVLNSSEYLVSFDILPDGRVVVCSMPTNPPGEYAVRIHPPAWPLDPSAGPPETYPNPAGLTLVEVWAVAGGVVAFGSLIERNKPATHRAYLLDGGRFEPAPGLPLVAAFSPTRFAHQTHANGKVTLRTGEDVLVWDGEGYEWDGSRFEHRWGLGARERAPDGWTAVPWGDDGFFYISDWRVMYARRGQKPEHVHPDAQSVISLSPGPEDCVILSQHRDPKRFVGRVWFPEEGTYIPVVRANIGYKPSWHAGPMHWSAATRHVHVGALLTFPDADVLALKRVKPRGSGYRVPKAG